MSFGKRVAGVSSLPRSPGRGESAKPGHFRLALVYAAGGFATSIIAAATYAVTRDPGSGTSASSLIALATLLAGPTIMAVYAVALLIIDVVFRRPEVVGRAAYTVAGGALPLAIFLLIFAIAGKLGSWPWDLVLVGPGGFAGGYALGRSRKPSDPAMIF